MKILYIFPRYGLETFAISEVEALRESGEDVSVLGIKDLNWRSRNFPYYFGVGPWQMSFWIDTLVFFLKSPLFFISQFFCLFKENLFTPKHLVMVLYVKLLGPRVANYIRRNKFDLVYIFWGHYPVALAPFIKHLNRDIPIIAFLGAYSLLTRFPYARKLYKSIDGLTTHANFQIPVIQEYLGDNTKPLYSFLRGSKVKVEKEASNAILNSNTLLVVARLHGAKGEEDAIRAFCVVKKLIPNIELKILGDGPALKSLKELTELLEISSSVKFCGTVSHSEVINEMRKSRVLLFPSSRDVFPNVPKEAMAVGLPCIAYSITGVKDFDDLVPGCIKLVEKGDIPGLAKSIIELMHDPELCRKQILNGFECVKLFDINLSAKGIKGYFREMIDKKAA